MPRKPPPLAPAPDSNRPAAGVTLTLPGGEELFFADAELAGWAAALRALRAGLATADAPPPPPPPPRRRRPRKGRPEVA